MTSTASSAGPRRLWPTKRLRRRRPPGWTGTTYGEWADRTRRLGGVLDTLGISADGRVATFAWNNARHLELYFAAPCTGRVLHTLNIRLFADQLVYIVNHAEDEVIFVDRSLLPLLWPHIDELQDRPPRRGHGRLRRRAPGRRRSPTTPGSSTTRSCWPRPRRTRSSDVADENRAASMCYTSGTTGDPKGVVYSHRSVVLHSMAALSGRHPGVSEADVVLPVVPMFHANAWGLCQAAVMAGAELMFPGADLSPQAIAELIDRRRRHPGRRRAHHLDGRPPLLAGQPHRLRAIVCGGSAVPRPCPRPTATRSGSRSCRPGV